MKTTIDIADDLFERVQQLARDERTTFRALTEAGLRKVLDEREHKDKRVLEPLVTYGTRGLTPEFQGVGWDEMRDAIYGEPPA